MSGSERNEESSEASSEEEPLVPVSANDRRCRWLLGWFNYMRFNKLIKTKNLHSISSVRNFVSCTFQFVLRFLSKFGTRETITHQDAQSKCAIVLCATSMTDECTMQNSAHSSVLPLWSHLYLPVTIQSRTNVNELQETVNFKWYYKLQFDIYFFS